MREKLGRKSEMGKVTKRYVNMNKFIAGFILGAVTGAAIYQPAANWGRWGMFTLFSRGDK